MGKRDEIKQVFDDLGLRGVSDLPLKETDYFDDSDCYGSHNDFEQNAGPMQLEIEDEMKYKDRELES